MSFFEAQHEGRWFKFQSGVVIQTRFYLKNRNRKSDLQVQRPQTNQVLWVIERRSGHKKNSDDHKLYNSSTMKFFEMSNAHELFASYHKIEIKVTIITGINLVIRTYMYRIA
jgi:reverse gyrase